MCTQLEEVVNCRAIEVVYVWLVANVNKGRVESALGLDVGETALGKSLLLERQQLMFAGFLLFQMHSTAINNRFPDVHVFDLVGK